MGQLEKPGSMISSQLFCESTDKPISQVDYSLQKLFEMSTAGLDVTQRKGESGPAHQATRFSGSNVLQ